jgi:hypothetical protein
MKHDSSPKQTLMMSHKASEIFRNWEEINVVGLEKSTA